MVDRDAMFERDATFDRDTMFDRDRALARWREHLAVRGGISEQDIVELESHLLEQAIELQRKGLTEEEAFAISARRLGSPEQLNGEFEKIWPGAVVRQRLFWMLGGVLAFLLLSPVFAVIVQVLSLSYAGLARPDGGVVEPLSAWSLALALWVGGCSLAGVGLAYVLFLRGRLERWQLRLRGLAARPGVLIAVVVAVILGATALRVGITVVSSRLLMPEDFGRLAIVGEVLSLLWSVAVPVVVAALLVRSRQTRSETRLA